MNDSDKFLEDCDLKQNCMNFPKMHILVIHPEPTHFVERKFCHYINIRFHMCMFIFDYKNKLVPK